MEFTGCAGSQLLSGLFEAEANPELHNLGQRDIDVAGRILERNILAGKLEKSTMMSARSPGETCIPSEVPSEETGTGTGLSK